MTGEIEIHEDVGVDDGEGRTDKDTEEFVSGEMPVLTIRMRAFPFSHAGVAFENDAGEHRDIDAVVTELSKEASITVVDGSRYGTEVADVVVEGVAVDMVDGAAGRDVAFEGQVLQAGEVYSTKSPRYFQITRGRLMMLFIWDKIKRNLSVGGINVVRAGV